MFIKEKNSIHGVDIYIAEDKIEDYFAESYYLLKKHLDFLFLKIDRYNSYKSSLKRKEYFELLLEGYMQNANNVNEILNVVRDKVELSAFENLRINISNDTQRTLKDFVYLRRDWCFLEEGEKQLELIIENIKQELSLVDFQNKNSLFLGCGVGRIAYEFTDIYNTVYATDKSFSMIWHLQKLLRGETITFFKPQEKNVYKLENIAQSYQAKIPSERLGIKESFKTFVSDVMNLPFKSKTINSIFSIYFTDVIALKLWFQQINDKLSDNGLFIHFGPLDYFFSDEREMLTAEEFRSFFEDEGYKTIVDKIVETPHLEDSNSISYKVYRNWFFIAQKVKKKGLKKEIFDSTILKVKYPIPFERKGIIINGIDEQEVSIELPSGKFGGASSVIKILELVDGLSTFNDICEKLLDKGFEIKREEVRGLLESFINQNILAVI